MRFEAANFKELNDWLKEQFLKSELKVVRYKTASSEITWIYALQITVAKIKLLCLLIGNVVWRIRGILQFMCVRNQLLLYCVIVLKHVVMFKIGKVKKSQDSSNYDSKRQNQNLKNEEF